MSEVENKYFKRTHFKNIPLLFVMLSIIILALAIDYSNFIAALIGISLIFWGGLLMYITPNIFIKKEILEKTSLDYQNILRKIIQVLEYLGDPVYFSPTTVWGLSNCLLFIPKTNINEIPNEYLLLEKSSTIIEPSGILIEALGSKLSEKYEKILGISFSLSNLGYIKENIRKAIVEELEMSKNIHMEYEFSKVVFKINDSVFHQNTVENDKLMGDPLVSSLACTLAKTTRKPIKIENIKKVEKDKLIEATFRVVD